MPWSCPFGILGPCRFGARLLLSTLLPYLESDMLLPSFAYRAELCISSVLKCLISFASWKFGPFWLSESSVLLSLGLVGFLLCPFGSNCVLAPPPSTLLLSRIPSIFVILNLFTSPRCWPGGSLLALFLHPGVPWFLVSADPLFCTPVCSKTTKSCYLFCCLKGWLILTVLRSLLLLLVHLTGPLSGTLCPFFLYWSPVDRS